jgi:hypothetical protein
MFVVISANSQPITFPDRLIEDISTGYTNIHTYERIRSGQ